MTLLVWEGLYSQYAIHYTLLYITNMGSPIVSAKTRLGADCGSGHEVLIAKFRQIEESRNNH